MPKSVMITRASEISTFAGLQLDERTSRKMRSAGLRALLSAVMVGTTSITVGLATAGSAAAAAPCWSSGGRWWCNNVSGAPVYGYSTANGSPKPDVIVGYMYSNPSWFNCRRDNGPYVGGPHPYRWLWTTADNSAWGWMKDTAIYSETNPVSPC